jgi:hypothetical protein
MHDEAHFDAALGKINNWEMRVLHVVVPPSVV